MSIPTMIPYGIGPQIRIGSELGIVLYIDIDESEIDTFIKEYFSECMTFRRGVRYKLDKAIDMRRNIGENDWIHEGIIVLFTTDDTPNEKDRNEVIKYIYNISATAVWRK